jgi:predicted nuclease of restriction endonuclease-like (RecB) superfamily
MGKGFSFIGNQHRLVVDEDEFYIDLLFYNRILKCLVAFELKKGKFRPQDAGQLNRTGDPVLSQCPQRH